MANEAEIRRMAQSEDMEECEKALHELKNNFVVFIDKTQAWKDLLELTNNESYTVRRDALNFWMR